MTTQTSDAGRLPAAHVVVTAAVDGYPTAPPPRTHGCQALKPARRNGRRRRIPSRLTRGDRGKGAELGPTKTRDSKRTFDLSSIAAATLKEQRLNQLRQQAAAGERGFPWLNDWGLVFTMPLDEPVNPSTLLWDFGIRLKAAGLPPMRLHDLRHSCATLLHEAGVD